MFFNLHWTYWTFWFCFIYIYNAHGWQIQSRKADIPKPTRCGVCPTYFQKICGFEFATNTTFIFDNQCILDLYNCIHNREFLVISYEHCLYFGNFAYIHGLKYEDYDYGEDHITIKQSKKNPDLAE